MKQTVGAGVVKGVDKDPTSAKVYQGYCHIGSCTIVQQYLWVCSRPLLSDLTVAQLYALLAACHVYFCLDTSVVLALASHGCCGG